MTPIEKATLPDVSMPQPSQNFGSKLPWVGMREIELPVKFKLPQGSMLIASRLDLGVSLDRTDARGIHMSRLFRLAMEQLPTTELTLASLNELAEKALKTHEDLSSKLKLALKFSLPLQRMSLKSDGLGWRNYPVTLSFEKGASTKATMTVEVLYSSTCPASAALSRQINEQKSLEHFRENTIQREELREWLHSPASLAATPHAQRSRAVVGVELGPEQWNQDLADLLTALVEKLELALGTPVQTLVKREDEQEFARRNAENLMFCEDAARRIGQVLGKSADYLAFHGEVAHFESLHPHDAVAFFESPRST